jgi:hypothetical protein
MLILPESSPDIHHFLTEYCNSQKNIGPIENSMSGACTIAYIRQDQLFGFPYTTPIETMDRYYDNCKAGPWVGLIWWTSVGKLHLTVVVKGQWDRHDI